MSSGNPQEAISQIDCYSLPYGGIGFISHILTYYSIICVGLGVRPICPGIPIRHRLTNLILGGISLIICCVSAIVTMARCHKEWQFLLLAMWKFLLAITINLMGIHRCLLTGDDRNSKSMMPFSWLLVYSLGIILGLVGLVSLVSQSWSYQPVRRSYGSFSGNRSGVWGSRCGGDTRKGA